MSHVPCKEAKELFLNEPAVKKMLELPSNSGKYADEIVDTAKKISAEDVFDLFGTFADNNYYDAAVKYEKEYQQLLSKTSDLQEEVQAAIKYAEKPVALDILVETSKFGENVPVAVNKWGTKDFYTISHHIAESGVSNEIAGEIYYAWSEFGDVLPAALTKGGIKNTKHIIELRSKLASNQMLRVLKLTQDYGSNVITAIKKCGVENIDLIINGITLCDKPETAKRLLRALANHGDAILKVISKYPNLSTKTIEDYLKISETFGSNADEIINKNTVKEFIGLEDALKHTDKQAICFSSSEKGLCVVTVNGTRSYNDTIREVPYNVLQRVKNGNIEECSKAYDSLLRREHLPYIEQHYSKKIRDEYEKLVIAIEDARIAARDYPDAPEAIKFYDSGIDDDYTFYEGRSIINCAEIWAAREMILHGVKFEDIMLGTRHFSSSKKINGSLFPPCGNCKNVFWRIRSNVDGYERK